MNANEFDKGTAVKDDTSKGAILICNHKQQCYFHVWNYQIFVRKLTWYLYN